MNALLQAYKGHVHTTLENFSKNGYFDTPIEDGKNIFHFIAEDNSEKRADAVYRGIKPELKANNETVKRKFQLALNTLNNSGLTPLHVAADKCSYIAVEKFLEWGADPLIKCPKGKIAEIRAKEAYALNGYYHSRTVAAFKNYRHKHNLLEAFQEGDLNVVLSFDNIDNPNMKDEQGNNLLHLALKATGGSDGQIKMILERLIQCHVDVNHANKRGETPLMLAMQKGYKKTVGYLVYEANADFWWRDAAGDTILHFAARNLTDVEMMKIIWIKCYEKEVFENGNKVQLYNVKNKDQQTPLHVVKDPNIADWFCERGADLNIEDGNKNTPLKSHTGKNDKVVAVLKKRQFVGVPAPGNSATDWDALLKDLVEVGKVMAGSSLILLGPVVIQIIRSILSEAKILKI